MLMKQQRAEDAVRVWIFHGSRAVHVIHTVWSAEQTNSFKPVETLSSTVLWISGTAAIGVRTFVIYSVTRVARRWARVGGQTLEERNNHTTENWRKFVCSSLRGWLECHWELEKWELFAEDEKLESGEKKWRDKGRPVEKVIADDFILETMN